MPRSLARVVSSTAIGLAALGLSASAAGAQTNNTVSVLTDTSPRLGNPVTVRTEGTDDPWDFNDEAAVYTPVRREWTAAVSNRTTDLSIVKDDGGDTAVPGESVTYTITVTNRARPGLGRLFVFDNDSDLISELDPATGAVLNSFASPVRTGLLNEPLNVPDRTFGMATTPTSLLVGGYYEDTAPFDFGGPVGEIFELDPDTGATLRTLPNPGLEIFAMAFRNDEIFVSGFFESYPRIAVLDYATGAVKRTLALGCLNNDPTGLAWSVENLLGIGFEFEGLVLIDPQTGFWIDPLTGDPLVIEFGETVNDDCVDLVETINDSGVALIGGGLGVIGNEVFGTTDSGTSIGVYDLETSTLARTLTGFGDINAIGADEGAGSDVVGATVSDTFPAELSCTWTCVASGGASCTAGPVAGDIADSVDIPVGDSVVYTAVCDVDPAATGMLSNTAAVAPPAGVTDFNSSNDDSTDVDTLTPMADLSISKSDDQDPVAPGGTLTYTVDVDNAGPSDATLVVATDTLPAGVTFGSTSGCPSDPNGVPTCDLGTIPAGGSASYTIEVSVDPTTPSGTITNDASVASSTPDPVPDGETASEDTLVDAEPPVVSGVDSVAGTGDGQLQECEEARVAITQLLVTFDEPVQNPAGNADASDVTNPTNYRLLAAGPDGDFATSFCGPAFGDDASISVDSVAYDSGTSTATLTVNGGSPLRDSLYRLLVCGSTTIRDIAGNALDGNADGIGGDDFVRTYRVERSNQFVNGQLDCSIESWVAVSTVADEIIYSSEDVDDSSVSGSARITNLTASTDFSLAQCPPIVGGTPYDFRGSVRVDAEPGAGLFLSRVCELYSAPSCTGSPLLTTVDVTGLADTDGMWDSLASRIDTPSGRTVGNLQLRAVGTDGRRFRGLPRRSLSRPGPLLHRRLRVRRYFGLDLDGAVRAEAWTAGSVDEHSIQARGGSELAMSEPKRPQQTCPEQTCPVRATGIEIEEAGDGFIVYDPARDRVHYLNHTAALVLELANGQLDEQGIANWIARVYSLEEAPLSDVVRLIGELTGEGLLAGAAEPSPDPDALSGSDPSSGRPDSPNRSQEEEGSRHVAR